MKSTRSLFRHVAIGIAIALTSQHAGVPTAARGATIPKLGAASAPAQTVRAQNQFAVDLYRRLASQTGRERNIVVAPFAASAGLLPLLPGACGATKQQLAALLAIDDPIEEGLAAHAALLRSLAAHRQLPVTTKDVFCIAATLWLRRGSEPGREYRAALDRLGIGTEIRTLPSGAAEISSVVNQWVQQATAGELRAVVDAAVVGNPSLLLVDATYFKAAWQNSFDAKMTRMASFFSARGKLLEVPTMQRPGQFRHLAACGAHYVSLPYANARTAMLVCLPDDKNGLDAWESQLSGAALQQTIQRIEASQPTLVNVRIPRMRLSFEADLKPALSAMGGSALFDVRADFSGISSTIARGTPISGVRHSALLEVTEEGTTAAAATAIVIPKFEAPVLFNADHPFLACIYDRASGAVLFLARVVDPAPAIENRQAPASAETAVKHR